MQKEYTKYIQTLNHDNSQETRNREELQVDKEYFLKTYN